MSRARPFMSLVLGLALCAVVPQRAGAEPVAPSPDAETAVPLDEPPALAVPDAETARLRTRTIARGLRCPVCQGLSVADSNADSARAMFQRIEELVAQGYSQDQILDYFTDRYGGWVRLEPEAEGLNLLIFVLPAALLVVGGLWLVARTPPMPPSTDASSAPIGPAPDSPPDAYRKRILDELGDGP